MPRNLPWKLAARTTEQSASPLTKRQKLGSDGETLNDGDASTSLMRAKDSNVHDDLSSSLDIVSEQLMKPGIEHDDAYIMVEDEFLATARTFTAPLHHAEYKRQKALARARKQAAVTALPDTSVNGAMSAVLRRQKALAGNLARSRAALEAVGALRASGDDSDSSSSDLVGYFGEDDKGPNFDNRNSPPRAEDPWLGTSLAPLLSPRKRRAEAHLAAPPSLLDLHGKRSDTRAARGFGAAEVVERRPRAAREYDLPSARASASAAGPGSASETEGDSDDLDGPAKARATDKTAKISARRELPGLPLPPSRVAGGPTKRETVDLPSDSPSRTRQRPWLTNKGKAAMEGRGRKGMDVKEIPTFLV